MYTVSVAEEQANSKRDSIKAYKQYLKDVENGDNEAALISATRAYELGQQYMSPGHKSLAAMAFNLGRAQLELRDYETTIDTLKDAVSLYEKAYSKDSIEMVDPLMELAIAYTHPGKYDYRIKSYQLLEKTGRLVKKHLDINDEMYADIQREIGVILLDELGYREFREYLTRAYDSYKSLFGDHHGKTALASFYLAKYFMTMKNDSEALKHMKLSSEYLGKEQSEYGRQLYLSTHAFMVELYERQGMREEANKHCQLIAKADPWKPDQEPRPLYQLKALYPRRALELNREGHVIVGFSIDEYGFVSNARVVKVKGHKSFGRAALKSINNWRFVPQFKDGEAVATDSVTWEYTFVIAN